ncbi:VOC family protein, partial [bacterium]|nr:VOC family protein [bacterium]
MELTTCLWFDGRAREAANFYTSIFPNSSVA